MIEPYKFHTDPSSLLGGKQWVTLHSWAEPIKDAIANTIEDMNSNGWEMEQEDEDYQWHEIVFKFVPSEKGLALQWQKTPQESITNAYFKLDGTDIQCYNAQFELIGTVSALGDFDDFKYEFSSIVFNLDWGLD